MATIKTAAASAAQLLVLATEVYGLEVAKADAKSADKIRAVLATAGFTDEEFEVADEPDDAPKAPTQAQVQNFDDERRVKIMIPHQEGVPGGSEAVPVGVNGVVARIMRGVEVEVPMKYVRVLQNANKLVFDKDENGQIVGSREVPMYPFSVLQAL